MANRFDTKEFFGRTYDESLKKDLEEKVKNFLFDEGCYGATGVANVIIEILWEALRASKSVK